MVDLMYFYLLNPKLLIKFGSRLYFPRYHHENEKKRVNVLKAGNLTDETHTLTYVVKNMILSNMQKDLIVGRYLFKSY